jgi:hypothetical protein
MDIHAFCVRDGWAEEVVRFFEGMVAARGGYGLSSFLQGPSQQQEQLVWS